MRSRRVTSPCCRWPAPSPSCLACRRVACCIWDSRNWTRSPRQQHEIQMIPDVCSIHDPGNEPRAQCKVLAFLAAFAQNSRRHRRPLAAAFDRPVFSQRHWRQIANVANILLKDSTWREAAQAVEKPLGPRLFPDKQGCGFMAKLPEDVELHPKVSGTFAGHWQRLVSV